MNRLFFIILLLSPLLSFSQENSYTSDLEKFREQYVKDHGAVGARDKKKISFFSPDESYKITARFERIYDAPWFGMITSSGRKKPYRVYGILHFTLKGREMKLHIYESQDLMQSEKYADHLFIPFTDPSNGEETYENGRYIDLLKSELTSDTYSFDFNRAYNPYCAYVSGKYSCPLPPEENALPIEILAGEKKFVK